MAKRVPAVMALVACAYAAGATRAWAAATDFDWFEPTVGPEVGLAVESARVGDAGWTVGSVVQYAHRPVKFNVAGGGDVGVDARVQARILVARQAWNRVLFGFDAPVVLYEKQNLFGGETAGFNDIRLRSRIKLAAAERWALGLGLGALVPTGRADVFGGSDKRALQPTLGLLSEFGFDGYEFRLTVGYQERDDTDLPAFNLEIRDRLEFGAAAVFPLPASTNVFVEYAHRTQLQGSSELSNAGELFAGAQVTIGNWRLKPAIGVAMTSAFGLPSVRAVIGVSHSTAGMPTPPPKEQKPAKAGLPRTGTVRVKVKSTAGALLTDADIVVLRDGKEVARGRSDAEGQAEFSLSLATYAVRVELAAFTTAEMPVMIRLGQIIDLPAILSPAPAAPSMPCAAGDNNCKLQWWYEQNRTK